MSEYMDFLGSEFTPPKPEEALFHVISAPYEKTVSYGGGTVHGPKAILEASQQLEVFDGVSIPSEHGICTRPALACAGTDEEALAEIRQAVSETLGMGKIPVMLGGEHTVTVGALRALKEQIGEFGVVQFDAHADLRDEYEGDPLSHACVMRRAVDMGLPILQIGIRSFSPKEHVFREAMKVARLDAVDIAKNGIPATILPPDFPEKIYVTFDVDGLDPSVIPATGTPEPGGLTWWQAMSALEKLCGERKVIGFDVVELAPIQGMHSSDFAVARLIHNFMGFITRAL